MSYRKFTGIMPALITPLTEDERINVEVLDKLLNYLIDKKADGFYIGGATGEGLALRPEERRVLAEESIRIIGGRVPSIVQIASTDYNQAIELAKHAEAAGADAISATPPLFFAYDEDDIFNYYKGLAEAVHIPLIIYYNPAAGFTVNAKFAARAFQVDNITGIKWTSSDYFQMMLLKDMTHGEMNVINGPDEMLLMGLNAGADGGIGTTYNFMMDIIRGVWDNFHAGNIEKAREYQLRAAKIIYPLLQYKGIPTAKVIMEAMGFDVGYPSYPMKHYTAEQKQEVLSAMRAAGLEI